MWSALVCSFIVSLAVVWVVKYPGLGLANIDTPNHRSLHRQPTPSGGGIGIVLGSMAGGIAYAGFGVMVFPSGLLLAVGVALAVAGYADDRHSLTVVVRLAIQIVAAVTVILSGLKLTGVVIVGLDVGWPDWLAVLFTGLFVIWMINLYNFMDGMDGLAATMAVVGFGTLGWLGFSHGDTVFAVVVWAISLSSLGFLLFNLPPARIFMGDVGSTVLGYSAAVVILWADRLSIAPFWLGVLIFSPFIVDSTATLLRRALAGERFWEAHRSHYYQQLVGFGWSHRRTLAAETLLMLACALSAVSSVDQSSEIQWLTASFWLLIYLLLMYSVSRMDAPTRIS
jgi:UDP-N-acetylmuramyl pentapeptide phosphotransferase/UDP-N-acetylglucosamine-1-phosphate transferase